MQENTVVLTGDNQVPLGAFWCSISAAMGKKVSCTCGCWWKTLFEAESTTRNSSHAHGHWVTLVLEQVREHCCWGWRQQQFQATVPGPSGQPPSLAGSSRPRHHQMASFCGTRQDLMEMDHHPARSTSLQEAIKKKQVRHGLHSLSHTCWLWCVHNGLNEVLWSTNMMARVASTLKKAWKWRRRSPTNFSPLARKDCTPKVITLLQEGMKR